ncbi:MAG: hypothetical protein Q7S56_00495 [Nanoarchaeota archaeon]|nr:hypothetical protein [Nanoarchaeota archaeon]
MNLDQIARDIVDKETEFKESIKLMGDKINLDDVIKTLKSITAFPLNGDPSTLRVRYGIYTMFVSDDRIDLSIYENLINRHFEGEEIKPIYKELRRNYKEAQRKESLSKAELLRTVQ